jgi:hypothetical protein
LGWRLTFSHHKKETRTGCCETLHFLWDDISNVNVNCNVRVLYKPGSSKTVSKELRKCDLVGIEEVRWDKCGTDPADDYTFLYGNGSAICHLGTGFFIHKGVI